MSAVFPVLPGALAGGAVVTGAPAGAAGQQCFTGTVQVRPEAGIPFAGTHLLVDANGSVTASLVSSQVSLDALAGQTVTVCGFGQGVIEGVPALAVTQATPMAGTAVPQPQLTGLFVCGAGSLAPSPLFFAPSPVNATLRTGSGDVLLIVPGASPEALSSLTGQFVFACGLLTTNNEVFAVTLIPLSLLFPGGLSG